MALRWYRMVMFEQTVQAVMDRVDALRHQVTDHWQIPRDEAQVLSQLVRIGRCQCIVEIGTSYGYSTLHLAAAAQQVGGHVHSIDIEPRKTRAAADHLRDAGLASHVTLHTGDARDLLATINLDAPCDFAFIDAVKQQCFAYLDALLPRMAAHGVIVTDNTVTHAAELASFIEHLRTMPDADSCGLPVGNGIEVTVLRRGGGDL